MNKKNLFKTATVLILVLVLLFFWIRGFRSQQVLRQQRERDIKASCPHYVIDAVFDPDKKTISAKQEISIQNNYGKELTELCFHLYPNAFISEDMVPFPKNDLAVAYPEGFGPGKIDIKQVKTDFSPLKYQVKDTILKVFLPAPLAIGESLKVNIEFESFLPPSVGRFGYGKNTFNGGNWYPILAVYENNQWRKDPYYAIGDPFYSETSLYSVRIKAPCDFTIAATGNLISRQETGDYILWDFKTELVRDFAWVASNRFKQAKEKLGKTQVISYYFEEDEPHAKEALKYAKDALKAFNRAFGKYPYRDFSVVAADFYIGGMEYPNLVIIGKDFYFQEELLEYIIAHETAHQWWYGLVGNDQIKEPWLDEALAEYSTILYYESKYGKKTGEKIYQEFILNPYHLFELGQRPGTTLRSLDQFSDWKDYSASVYSKGAIILKELERRMGKGKLLQGLNLYLEEFIYSIAKTEDFVKIINKVSGTDWSKIIYDMLKGEISTKPEPSFRYKNYNLA